MMNIPVFDGHNDTLTRIAETKGTEQPLSFITGNNTSHIDLPRAQKVAFAGGFFAIFCSNPVSDGYVANRPEYVRENGYEVPLPPPIDQDYCADFCHRMIDEIYAWQKSSAGQFKVVTTAAEIAECAERGEVAAIIHFEGAEAIKSDLSNLQEFYDRGLRSIGPVWSRPNWFGHGVPFVFPSSPDTGPGLTEQGTKLVRACDEMGIMLDVSHLNEKGFWDLAKATEKPIIATHCAAWTLSHSSRNLTDQQLDAIATSGGIIGVNFCKNFLREDGHPETPTTRAEVVRHVRYLVNRLGIDHVALGSDFDGASMPHDLDDVLEIPGLLQDLKNAGISDSDLRKIAFENWLKAIENNIG